MRFRISSETRDLIRIVGRRDPQAQHVGAEGVHDLLRRDDVAEGLRHLAALVIDREAVGEHAAVRRALVEGLGHEQRAVEPAAVLIGALQIQLHRGCDLGPLAPDALEGQARVRPHVHDVGDLVVVLGVIAEQLARLEREPGIDAPRLRRAWPPPRSAPGCADAARPSALCTNSGIGTPQVRWREMHQSGRVSIMPVMRCSPQAGVHCTPLMSRSVCSRSCACSMLMNHCGRGAEDDRALVAPAMRVTVAEGLLVQQSPGAPRAPAMITGFASSTFSPATSGVPGRKRPSLPTGFSTGRP